jgi:chromosome partitioning protein
MKGGSGKTTLAVCLAAWWMRHGVDTALVDADPQRSALRWVGSGDELASLKMAVVDEVRGPSVATTISELLDQGYQRIIVDTPGFRAPTTSAVLERSHLVLVPIKASPVDFEVAADTMDLIQEIASSRSDPTSLKVRFVLSQTVLRSVVARHIRQELTGADYPLLDAELSHRVAHVEAPFTGSTPGTIDPKSAAAKEIEALGTEVDTLLG